MSAKTLNNQEFLTVLTYVHQTSPHALRDTVALMLSFKAGMRVGEIAGLSWGDVQDAFGQVRSDIITVPAKIAKKGSGRTIPMHPAVHASLVAWRQELERRGGKVRSRDPVVPSTMGPRDRIQPNSLQRYIGRLFTTLGLEGCSSHSGRRSFITAAARKANQFGCSLRDVQRLAGHRDIETTELYIEASEGVVDLVRAI